MRMWMAIGVVVLLASAASAADKFGGQTHVKLKLVYGGVLSKNETTSRSTFRLTLTLDTPDEIERADADHPKDPAKKFKKGDTFSDTQSFLKCHVIRDGKEALATTVVQGDYVELYLSGAPNARPVLVAMSAEFRKTVDK